MRVEPGLSLNAIATATRGGAMSAAEHTAFVLQRIARLNPEINCFTAVLAERALQRARDLDARIAAGEDTGPLTGVPFAVKNLFDVAGLSTLAGSLINASHPPASVDAPLIQRLEAAGAILVGALGMGEYAYDFTGENAHYGACRNPWDTTRMSGGSSSGSAAAVAGGLVPLTLGSDTNGSIRVPSSLCGLFGLKPTYGRLTRTGTFPFSESLDHVGPLSQSAEDLALAFDCLQGAPEQDVACVAPSYLNTSAELTKGAEGLRFGRAGGFFDCTNFPEAATAVSLVCDALGVTNTLPLEGCAEGRAAAYLITNAEGAALHRDRLMTRLDDFDPDTRDRFLAGSLFPATWYIRAQQVRRRWLEQMLEVFADVDVIIAPCTPTSAPLLGSKMLNINGVEHPLRPNLGLFTQPFSAIGLPVCAVPVQVPGSSLPIGVQIVAPPWREDLCLRVAWQLERQGLSSFQLPRSCA